MKVIFRKSDGRLLGAQMLGEDGVPSRINAFAMAIQAGLTVYDLEESELAYAPPFGSAKDPVNFAGMVAADILRDDMPICHWDAADHGFLLDVRQPAELAVEQVPGAVNIPLPELRAAWPSFPRPRDPRLLPLRPARLLRNAHPAAERVQSPEHLRRHAVTFASCRDDQVKTHRDNPKKKRSAYPQDGSSPRLPGRSCSACWRTACRPRRCRSCMPPGLRWPRSRRSSWPACPYRASAAASWQALQGRGKHSRAGRSDCYLRVSRNMLKCGLYACPSFTPVVHQAQPAAGTGVTGSIARA